MLGNVLRDTPQIPALQEILNQKWGPYVGTMVEILMEGWEVIAVEKVKKTNRLKELNASIKVALDFFTWQTLISSGLSDRQAAHVASKWIKAFIKNSNK